ncbi:MAG TPA: PP0621 family protein [Ramlibacter sp.]|nr:PP0621 family protein [Ramlibacter sp.]
MKYVIVLAIVLVAIWLWRSSRARNDERSDLPPAEPKAKIEPPQDMVRCPVCSLHLPRTDALPGPDGQMYCCAAHRLRAAEK